MGGEKLKPSRPRWGAFFAAFFIVAGFFNSTFPLLAQARAPSPGEEIAESSIILGETPELPSPSGASSIFVVLRMVLVLALASLAIYGVVFFIKRLARPQEIRDPHLKVLARVSLGSDSYAAVISVGPKAWLVGGGSGGVNLISEIDDTESLETMLLDDARKSAETGSGSFIDFRALLGRLRGASREAKGEDPGSTHAEALRKQRERLKGL